jgi:hypothetical protein
LHVTKSLRGDDGKNSARSYRRADNSLARPGFDVHISYYHNWRNISTIYIYIYRERERERERDRDRERAKLASNEIFSPTNNIHPEVDRAKDLSAPRYNSKHHFNW